MPVEDPLSSTDELEDVEVIEETPAGFLAVLANCLFLAFFTFNLLDASSSPRSTSILFALCLGIRSRFSFGRFTRALGFQLPSLSSLTAFSSMSSSSEKSSEGYTKSSS